MNCGRCGTENRDDSKFCKACGAGLRLALAASSDLATDHETTTTEQDARPTMGITEADSEHSDKDTERPWKVLRFLITLAAFIVTYWQIANRDTSSASSDYWSQAIIWLRTLPGLVQAVVAYVFASIIGHSTVYAIRQK